MIGTLLLGFVICTVFRGPLGYVVAAALVADFICTR